MENGVMFLPFPLFLYTTGPTPDLAYPANVVLPVPSEKKKKKSITSVKPNEANEMVN